MKEFSVCYDKFCMGHFSLHFDEEGKVIRDKHLGAFEMYLLGMWNDGMVVTMKGYDEEREDNQFILLFPDGSEQLMTFSREKGFEIKHFQAPEEGRFAYLLEFLRGLEYKGFRGYEEYDEEENMIIGTVMVGDDSLVYGGQNMSEVKEEFRKIIDALAIKG